jgi:hypothetical protein
MWLGWICLWLHAVGCDSHSCPLCAEPADVSGGMALSMLVSDRLLRQFLWRVQGVRAFQQLSVCLALVFGLLLQVAACVP